MDRVVSEARKTRLSLIRFSLGFHCGKNQPKRGFRTGISDGRTNRWTDGRTDKPSYRDAFLMDASEKKNKKTVGERDLRDLLICMKQQH